MPSRKVKSRAARNIAWIEKFCRVPEGHRDMIGEPVRLRNWQRKELRKIYNNPAGTRQAIISFPRKNGKTALISFLLLLHLAGPEAVPNSQLYSAAQSKEQAATVFKLAAKVVRMNAELNAVITIRDTVKELVCPEIGTYYAALSAEKSTAHGKSPIFAVHDELGQVKGPVSELYEAVETGMGAHEAPLSIVISTQAPTDADLLSVLIDDALAARDPQTVVSVYAAPIDADPFAAKTLKACNPAWGDFLNAREILRTRDKARDMPSSEAAYRNLHLNQRIEMRAPFISRSVWQACGGPVEAEFDGLPVYGGLDLSSVNDLTAKVYVAPVDGKWHVKPVFWLPGEGLREKARGDRVPYDVWAEQGHLLTTPGRTINYAFVAESLYRDCQEMDVRSIAFDRWNFRHLRPWLIEAGFSEDQVEGDDAIFKPFGQGYQSMSPALRDLEADLLDGKFAHGNHPVLTMCAANAVVTADPAGNRKLDKAKATGRIDGMVALAMARAVAATYETEGPSFIETYGVMVL